MLIYIVCMYVCMYVYAVTRRDAISAVVRKIVRCIAARRSVWHDCRAILLTARAGDRSHSLSLSFFLRPSSVLSLLGELGYQIHMISYRITIVALLASERFCCATWIRNSNGDAYTMSRRAAEAVSFYLLRFFYGCLSPIRRATQHTTVPHVCLFFYLPSPTKNSLSIHKLARKNTRRSSSIPRVSLYHHGLSCLLNETRTTFE